MPYPIGWRPPISSAGQEEVPGAFLSNGEAIKEYLAPADNTKAHMNQLLVACFGKSNDVLEDIKNAEDPIVVIEAIVWYKSLTLEWKESPYWVYGTCKNIALHNIKFAATYGDANGANMAVMTNKALPKCMYTVERNDTLNIDIPKNLGGNIPSSDLVK